MNKFLCMTEQLYYNDSYLLDFEARIIGLAPFDENRCALTLDRTAFYPTSGGQPHDTGVLALAANPRVTARVIECLNEGEGENADVLHIVARADAEKFKIGASVEGHVNRARRFDHLQQHTAQHILSQAFVQLFKAETRSFRMFSDVSEIDVALDAPSAEKIEQALTLANEIVWQNRSLRIIYAAAEEAKNFNLRKEPKRAGILRLIEIEDFDVTPCGGTHAKRTGEVGIILARAWERAKGMTRIEFVAGRRALTDYQRANETARRVAAFFSVERDAGARAVARVLDENKTLARRVREQSEELARHEASELLALIPRSPDKLRVVAREFLGRDIESLNALARAIVAHPHTVALLASIGNENERELTENQNEQNTVNVRLVFARSNDVQADMNALMRTVCVEIGGRGGGRPDFAQGGGKCRTSELASRLNSLAASAF
jgi:alanyl-tRNA synthetase